MRDKQGVHIETGDYVFISAKMAKQIGLEEPASGIVIDCRYNRDQLVTVSTYNGSFDLHAKSLSINQ